MARSVGSAVSRGVVLQMPTADGAAVKADPELGQYSGAVGVDAGVSAVSAVRAGASAGAREDRADGGRLDAGDGRCLYADGYDGAARVGGGVAGADAGDSD